MLKLELEILPPRDQNEIESIHAYLKTMREVQEVELLTLVDKSLFKVTLNHPVDFMEKLGQLPQVHNAEEVRENGKKKIKIALSAKSKLERNHNEVNDKVNKILTIKKSDPTADITTLEKEIDQLVYALYGLTEEEIRIVEGEK